MFSLYIFFASVTLIRRIQLNFAFGFFFGGGGDIRIIPSARLSVCLCKVHHHLPLLNSHQVASEYGMSLFGSSLEGFSSIPFSCSGVQLCSEVSNAAVFFL